MPRPPDPERWKTLGPHLDRAFEMPEEERDAWLSALSAEDPRLAVELRELLDEERALSREGFLAGTAPLPESSPAGRTVGAYTLVSLIGQGGMGNVWLARRSDGRFEGKAAVKLLNASLVGRAGEARFRREASILARLTHPHIARLSDAGVTPEGQPYLVLELVDGVSIDRYCDEKGLDAPARVRLFLDVLGAVEHAHASLVVHRDIKPSNVLVDRSGAVKLLDFGIAKLLEEDANGAPTALTREGGLALTPEYAAPEQLTGGPITTATDVHALGTLLYVLLSGRHPAAEALRTPADLVKALVETDPERPSQRVADPARRRALEGDLDTIVAKALKKDPAERYPSVTALADDLTRTLRNQPIRARPDTLSYRAAKFVRRNRAGVALAAACVVALLAGLAGTVTEARRATRQAALAADESRRADAQRDFALRQLGRSEAINDLNAFLLSDAAPSGKPFTAGELLARAEELAEHAGAEKDDYLVTTLIAIGRQYASFEEDEKARRLLERAYALAGRLPDRAQRAKAACALASTLEHGGEGPRAEGLIREGLAALPKEPQFALDRVFCLLRGCEVARNSGDLKTGVARAEEARRVLADSRLGSALLELRVAMDVAEAYRNAGRLREATPAFEDALARLKALGRDRTETAGTLLNNWALSVDLQGRHLEAEKLYRRAIALSSAGGTEENVSPMLMNNLARSLKDLGRLREAANYADRAHAAATAAKNETVVSQSLMVRAATCRELGERDRAGKLLDELEARWRKAGKPAGYSGFATLASERAMLAQSRGDFAAALAQHAEAVRIIEPSAGELGDFLAWILGRRAGLHLEMRRFADAEADARRAVDLWTAAVEPGARSGWIGRCRVTLGKALAAVGRSAEARKEFAAAVPHLEVSLGAEHPETLEARQLSGS